MILGPPRLVIILYIVEVWQMPDIQVLVWPESTDSIFVRHVGQCLTARCIRISTKLT